MSAVAAGVDPAWADAMRVTFVRHSESVNNILAGETKDIDRTRFELARHPDAPLTDRGVQQADRVAERIAEENPEATLIVTSYFHRALRTAAAIEAAMKRKHSDTAVKVLVCRDFHEAGGHYEATLEGDDEVASPSMASVDSTRAHDGSASDAASPVGPNGSPAGKRLKFVGSPGRSSGDVTREFPSFHITPHEGTEDGWWRGDGKERFEDSAKRADTLWFRLADLARGGQHKSVVVVTHGHLFALMMTAAIKRGIFDPAGPQPARPEDTRLQNTGVTRVLLRPGPVPDGVELSDYAARRASSHAAPALLRLELENCGKHVEDIGSLTAANLPVCAGVAP